MECGILEYEDSYETVSSFVTINLHCYTFQISLAMGRYWTELVLLLSVFLPLQYECVMSYNWIKLCKFTTPSFGLVCG
jgi:hypothetical protein